MYISWKYLPFKSFGSKIFKVYLKVNKFKSFGVGYFVHNINSFKEH